MLIGAVVIASADISDLNATVASQALNLVDDNKVSAGTTYSSTKIDNDFYKKSQSFITDQIDEGITNKYWTTARNQGLINDTVPSGTQVYSSTKFNNTFATVDHDHVSSDVTDINPTIDNRIATHKGSVSGIAPLNATQKLTLPLCPMTSSLSMVNMGRCLLHRVL